MFSALFTAMCALAACGGGAREQTGKAETVSAKPTCAGELPGTVAGERLGHYLQAIDSGEETTIRAFLESDMDPAFRANPPEEMHVNVARQVHEQSGGLVVCRIEAQTPRAVLALVAGREDEKVRSIFMTVAEQAPHRVVGILIQPMDDAVLESPPEVLDAESRAALVRAVSAKLEDYVFEETVAVMQQRLEARLRDGAYDAITHPMPLAFALEEDLREVSKDGHLRVIYRFQPIPPDEEADAEPTPEQLEQMRAALAADNFGFAEVKVLDGNIGYVDLRGFAPPVVAKDAASEAMSKIADTRALIIDLRQNHGGHPAMVAFMASYLFGPEPVHLNDLYYRAKDDTEEFWTQASVPGKRFGPDKPVYVLTSAQTFSGGEEFAYDLRNLERATLVGEVTGGGAHPSDFVRVTDHVGVILPVGRPINPVTKTDWEGKGVQPHVKVPAEQALDKARELIDPPE